MIWLVWRQQRVPLLVALGLVGLVGLTAVVGGAVALTDAPDHTACVTGAQAPICRTWWEDISAYGVFAELLKPALVVSAVVAGAVAGAGLFGTELGRGTHGFTLTQSMPRLRWWGTALLVVGVPVAAVVALVTPVVGWANALVPADFRFVVAVPLEPVTFISSGVLPAGYSVLAFCLAASAGLLLRNVLGALGVTLAVVVAVLGVTTTVRLDYLPPVTLYAAIAAPGEPVQVSPYALDGVLVGTGYLDERGREISDVDAGALTCDPDVERDDCRLARGIAVEYERYQLNDRYWPIQAIESSILLALTTGALGAGLVGLRRRVH